MFFFLTFPDHVATLFTTEVTTFEANHLKSFCTNKIKTINKFLKAQNYS